MNFKFILPAKTELNISQSNKCAQYFLCNLFLSYKGQMATENDKRSGNQSSTGAK